MTDNNRHPSQEELIAFLKGDPDNQVADRVDHHLAVCSECVEKLASLTVQEDDFPKRLREIGEALTHGLVPTEFPQIQKRDEKNRYRLFEEIAEGGMGKIYRGYDQLLEREFALKVMRPSLHGDADATQRFLREAKICSRLQHPGIVPVHDIGFFADGRMFIAMKLVEGKTLNELIPAQKSISEWIDIFEQICQTIAYAHSQGIVHRDLKPQNIMVGEFGEVQVMDWGIAKYIDGELENDNDHSWQHIEKQANNLTTENPDSVDSAVRYSQTIAGQILGTPAYMSPEQAVGKSKAADKRSDVYSLGAILSELISGQPPLPLSMPTNRSEAEELARNQRSRISIENDSELESIITDCLASEPGQRPTDAAELSHRLVEYRVGRELKLRAAEIAKSNAEATTVVEQKRKKLVTLVCVLLLAMFSIIGWMANNYVANEKEKSRQMEQVLNKVLSLQLNFDESPPSLAKNELRIYLERQRANAKHLLSEAEILDDSEIVIKAKATLAQIEERLDVVDRQIAFELRLKTFRADLHDAASHAANSDTQFNRALNIQALYSYMRAFDRFGTPLHTDIELAISKLAKCPEDLKQKVIASLYEWEAILRVKNKTSLSDYSWVINLINAIDHDPIRRKLRTCLQSRDSAFVLNTVQSIEENITDPISVNLASNIYLNHGYSKEQIELLIRAYPKNIHDFWVNFNLGSAYASGRGVDRNPEMAIKHFTACCAIFPNNAAALMNIGECHFQLGELEEAEYHFNLCIEHRPEYATAFANLATVHLVRDNISKALKLANHAIQLNSDCAHAYTIKAKTHLRKKEIPAAYDAIFGALFMNPIHAENYFVMIEVMNLKKKFSESLHYAERWIDVFPQMSRAHLSKGLCHINLEQFELAAFHFKKSVELDPSLSIGYKNAGLAYIKLEKFEESIRILEKGIELDPDRADLYQAVCYAYHQVGEPDKAASARETMARLKAAQDQDVPLESSAKRSQNR